MTQINDKRPPIHWELHNTSSFVWGPHERVVIVRKLAYNLIHYFLSSLFSLISRLLFINVDGFPLGHRKNTSTMRTVTGTVQRMATECTGNQGASIGPTSSNLFWPVLDTVLDWDRCGGFLIYATKVVEVCQVLLCL